MKKESLERSKDKPLLSKGQSAAVGTVAAIAGYKYFRSPKITNHIQEAAQKGLTVGLSYAPNTKRGILGKLFYSKDMNFKNIAGDGPRSFKGLLYNKNVVENSKAYGEVTVNSAEVADKIMPIGGAKGNLHELPHIGKYFTKSRSLDSALKDINVDSKAFSNMSADQVKTTFKQIEATHGAQFIKPEAGQAMGKGTDQIYSPLSMATTHKKVKPAGVEKFFKQHKYDPNPAGAAHIQKNPDKYILQDYLGEVKERRIHTLNDKVVDEVRRFGGMEGTQTGAKIMTKVEKQTLGKDLTNFYKSQGVDPKKNPVALAFDAARDTNTGKLRFIEPNPNSGFLYNLTDVTDFKYAKKPWEYWSSHRMYKALTGKESVPVSGLRATAIGAGAAVGASQLKKTSSKKSDRKKNTLMAGAVGLGAYALMRGKRSPKFYHVVAENQKPFAQAQSTIKDRGVIQYGIDKLKHFKDWGDIKTISTSQVGQMSAKKRAKGKFYLDLHSGFLDDPALKTLKSNQIINRNKTLSTTLDDKVLTSKIPGVDKHMPRTTTIAESTTSDTLAADLRKQLKLSDTDDVILKPARGARGEGHFLRLSEIDHGAKPIKPLQEAIDLIRGKSTYSASPPLKKMRILENKQDYVAQQVIPSSAEYRVQSYNGKILDVSSRHNITPPMSAGEKLKLDSTVKGLETAYRRGTGAKGNTYLGHDVIMHKGNPTVIESNLQEGYFWRRPNKLYKEITGKDLSNVAAVKATGAAALTYGGAKVVDNRMKRRNR